MKKALLPIAFLSLSLLSCTGDQKTDAEIRYERTRDSLNNCLDSIEIRYDTAIERAKAESLEHLINTSRDLIYADSL